MRPSVVHWHAVSVIIGLRALASSRVAAKTWAKFNKHEHGINIHGCTVSSHPSPSLHHRVDFHHKETTQFTPTLHVTQKGSVEKNGSFLLICLFFLVIFVYCQTVFFVLLSFYTTTKKERGAQCAFVPFICLKLFSNLLKLPLVLS